MEALFTALILLACPVGMGLMMFFMAKGNRSKQAVPAPVAERSDTSAEHPMSLEVLREEHRRLGGEIERLEQPSPSQHGPAKHR